MIITISQEHFNTVLHTLELAKAKAYTEYLKTRKNAKDRDSMNTAILEWAKYQDVVRALKEIGQ